MDAEIDAGIAVEQCPGKDEEGEAAGADNERQDGRQCKGVGTVAGGEAVGTASIIVDDMNQGREGVLKIGGTQPLELGTEKCGAHLVRKNNCQNYRYCQHDCLATPEGREKNIENGRIHRNPYEASGSHHHEVVKQRGMQPV